MKTRYLHILAGLSILVLCISVCTTTSTAATVWSEDFEGGMTEWTTFAFETFQSGPVIEGNFSVVDGALTSMDDDFNFAQHDSTNEVGTWSFDLYVPDVPDGYVGVNFMSNGSRPLDFDTRMISIEATTEGTDHFIFWWIRGVNQVLTDIAYTPGGSIVGWHHIDVTRTSGGSFEVFFNGSHEYTTLTNDVIHSTYLECFALRAEGAMFDNIVVSDSIDITPPTTPPTTPIPSGTPLPWDLIAIGGGVAVVVIILAIVCLKRR